MRSSASAVASILPALLCVTVAGCGRNLPAPTDDSAGQAPASAPSTTSRAASQSAELPAGAAEAQARLAASPRHAEWAMIRTGPADSVRAWVVYPERAERAPVVLVVHEIFGLSHWIRAVADQLAAEGFLAIAPDLLTMRGIPATADGAPDPEVARTEIRTLDRDDIHRQLAAVAGYGMALPAASARYGIMGFCWGGTVAFEHAAHAPPPGGAVVFYGSSPSAELLDRIRVPVLGLYGENDARVNATIPAAEEALGARGVFEHHMFAGAGHGFLRAQDGQNGANLTATQGAWPHTVQWLRARLDAD